MTPDMFTPATRSTCRQMTQHSVPISRSQVVTLLPGIDFALAQCISCPEVVPDEQIRLFQNDA